MLGLPRASDAPWWRYLVTISPRENGSWASASTQGPSSITVTWRPASASRAAVMPPPAPEPTTRISVSSVAIRPPWAVLTPTRSRRTPPAPAWPARTGGRRRSARSPRIGGARAARRRRRAARGSGAAPRRSRGGPIAPPRPAVGARACRAANRRRRPPPTTGPRDRPCRRVPPPRRARTRAWEQSLRGRPPRGPRPWLHLGPPAPLAATPAPAVAQRPRAPPGGGRRPRQRRRGARMGTTAGGPPVGRDLGGEGLDGPLDGCGQSAGGVALVGYQRGAEGDGGRGGRGPALALAQDAPGAVQVDRHNRDAAAKREVGGAPMEGLAPAVGAAAALREDDHRPAGVDQLGGPVGRAPRRPGA